MQKGRISRGTPDRSLTSVNFSSANFRFTYVAAVQISKLERQQLFRLSVICPPFRSTLMSSFD